MEGKLKIDQEFYKFHAEEGIHFQVGAGAIPTGDYFGFIPMTDDFALSSVTYKFSARITGDITTFPFLAGVYIPISGGFTEATLSAGSGIFLKRGV